MPQNLEYKREYHTLANIPPRSLRAYVESRGWRKAGTYTYPGTAHIYESDANGGGITVMESTHFADYPLRMWEAIWALADAENREWSAVLSDLLMSDFDVVRVRWSGDSDDGAIPLDAGAALIQGSRDMLLAAACSAQRSQPAFRAGSNRKARSYIESARLRQTQRGSFIINIALPVPSLPIPIEYNTFPDKVILKLISGLSAVHKAARFAEYADKIPNDISATHESARFADFDGFTIETPPPLPPERTLSDSGLDFSGFADGVHNGVSANLCGALTGMLDDRAAESVDISVNWALSRLTAREPFEIRFDKSSVKTLKGASQFLKRMARRRAARGRA